MQARRDARQAGAWTSIKRHAGRAGIVYCISRKDVERHRPGPRACRGSARRRTTRASSRQLRRSTQERFLSEELDVVCRDRRLRHGHRPHGRALRRPRLASPRASSSTARRPGAPAATGCRRSACSSTRATTSTAGSTAHEERARGRGGQGRRGDADLDRCSSASTRAAWADDGIHDALRVPPPPARRVLRSDVGAEPADLAEAVNGCGACDVCLGELECRSRTRSVVAQKILSCVVRCEQRFGAAPRDGRAARRGHVLRRSDRRVTTVCPRTGIMSEHKIGRSARRGSTSSSASSTCACSDERYPDARRLSETGAGGHEAANAKSPCSRSCQGDQGEASRRRAQARRAAGGLDVRASPPVDQELFESPACSAPRARPPSASVPPYLVFNDRTLASMLASHKPRDARRSCSRSAASARRRPPIWGRSFLRRASRPTGPRSSRGHASSMRKSPERPSRDDVAGSDMRSMIEAGVMSTALAALVALATGPRRRDPLRARSPRSGRSR